MLTAFMLLVPTDYNTAHAVSISSPAQSTGKQAKASGSGAAAHQVPVTLYVMSQCPGECCSWFGVVSRAATIAAAATSAAVFDCFGSIVTRTILLLLLLLPPLPPICADAKFCQQAFKPILETLPTVATVRTEYIAKLKDEDELQCMHGQAECDGNRQQLCLQHHLPAAENKKFFQALLCHSQGAVNNINHLQTCMTTAGIASAVQADVLKCVDGTLGATLQVASAKQVAENAVQKSCTVFVDGVKRCIRDGGSWYDCPGGSTTQDFIKSICEAYKSKAGKPATECAAALGQDGTAT